MAVTYAAGYRCRDFPRIRLQSPWYFLCLLCLLSWGVPLIPGTLVPREHTILARPHGFQSDTKRKLLRIKQIMAATADRPGK